MANPHLRILTYGSGLRLDDWRNVVERIRKFPGVVAASPEVISQAGITAGQDYGEGVNLVGFDTDTGAHSVTSLPQAIKKGDLSFRTTKPNVDGGILLGMRLANRLSVYPGDVVTLVPVTEAKVNPALGVAVPRFWRFEVTGLFDTGMFQYDNQFVVVRRDVAQRFTGLGDAVSGIAVRVADRSIAEVTSLTVARDLAPLGYEIVLAAQAAAIDRVTVAVDPTPGRVVQSHVRRYVTPHTISPHTHFLSNGSYVVMLTNAGSGFSRRARRHVLRGRHLLLHSPERPAAAVAGGAQDAVYGTFRHWVDRHRIVNLPRTVCDVDHTHVRIEDLQAFVGP